MLFFEYTPLGHPVYSKIGVKFTFSGKNNKNALNNDKLVFRLFKNSA